MNFTNYKLFDDDRLNQFVNDNGHHYTEVLEEAMFLWPNGKLTSSTEDGIRGDTHDILRSYFDNLDNDTIFTMPKLEMYEIAASTVGTVLISPETEAALLANNQALTQEQIEILIKSSFSIDYFSEGISQNQGLQKLGIEEVKMNSTDYVLFDEEELQQFVYDTGQHFTDDANEAMFLWPNGKMTSSFEQGIRADDHNIISSYFESLDTDEIYKLPRNEMLEVAASTSGVIMLVPETRMALRAENQQLTREQEKVLKNISHEVGIFAKGITPELALKKLDISPDQIEERKEQSQLNGITR
ncbi:hypothetical protein FL865_13635 [Listeria monocytogenes]|nr:hypothetical protein [Listeria monocytogenes]